MAAALTLTEDTILAVTRATARDARDFDLSDEGFALLTTSRLRVAARLAAEDASAAISALSPAGRMALAAAEQAVRAGLDDAAAEDHFTRAMGGPSSVACRLGEVSEQRDALRGLDVRLAAEADEQAELMRRLEVRIGELTRKPAARTAGAA